MKSTQSEGSDRSGGGDVNDTTNNGTAAGSSQTSDENTPVCTFSLVLVRIVVNDLHAKITITESDLHGLFPPAGYVANPVNDNAPIVLYGEGWDMQFTAYADTPPPGRTFHSTANPGSRVDLQFTGMPHSLLESAS